jgi:lycopene cyclase domain-containing protein
LDHWQYLFVLAACLAITAPLEMFGAGVYRQPRRAATAILPAVAVFLVWDAIAIAAHVWTYNPRYVTGLELPGSLPIEELLFFVVIPVCGLLTYNAVEAILRRMRRIRARPVQRS